MKFLRTFCLSLVFFAGLDFCFAEYNKFGVPDSSAIRKQIEENWFYKPLSELRMNRNEIRRNSVGQNFQVRLEESDGIFSVIVAPEAFISVDFYTQDGMKRDTVSEYSADAPGSWILMRSSATEKPVKIRYYFVADSDVYIQFSPDGNKTLADYVIDGCYAARSVPVGVPFEKFYTASFAEVIALTKKSLPWKYSEIHTDQYHQKLQMVGVIRKNLSRIFYEWDACYDENGNPVRISDGKARVVSEREKNGKQLSMDSAGFLKWVIDGLVEPIAGSLTYLKPLLRPTTQRNPVGYTGILEQKENLSYTLDWTRNLAAARLSVQTKKTYLYEDSGVDVNIEPFSAEVTEKGITLTAGYLKNTGYSIKKLKPVLYVLGVTEPTFFYLAAVRRRVPSANGKPEFYVFDQCAVILPYFDQNGQFACTVFEDGEEMTINQFINRYPDSYVHLTRVLSSDRFFPQ